MTFPKNKEQHMVATMELRQGLRPEFPCARGWSFEEETERPRLRQGAQTSLLWRTPPDAPGQGSADGREFVNALRANEPVDAADPMSSVVFVVDDDDALRIRLDVPGNALGWNLRHFRSVHAFLENPPVLRPSCLVLNAALPDLDLIDLQERIAVDRPGMPIILITGTADAQTLMQARPVGPVRHFARSRADDRLVDAIASALERGRPVFGLWAHVRDLRSRYASLSPRERQVMALVVSGSLNKQVGDALGICEITVKAHRGNVMRKMRAASLPGLVTMAARLGFVNDFFGSAWFPMAQTA